MAAPALESQRTVKLAAAGQLTANSFKVDCITWITASEANRDIAAADVCILQDGAGEEIVNMKCVTAGVGFCIPMNGRVFAGLNAQTLDGGIVYIHGERV